MRHDGKQREEERWSKRCTCKQWPPSQPPEGATYTHILCRARRAHVIYATRTHTHTNIHICLPLTVRFVSLLCAPCQATCARCCSRRCCCCCCCAACCLSVRLFDCLTICPFLLSAVRGSRKTWIHSWYHSPTERRCGYFMFGIGIVSVWLIWIECAHWGTHSLHSLNLPLSIVPLISCQLEHTFH